MQLVKWCHPCFDENCLLHMLYSHTVSYILLIFCLYWRQKNSLMLSSVYVDFLYLLFWVLQYRSNLFFSFFCFLYSLWFLLMHLGLFLFLSSGVFFVNVWVNPDLFWISLWFIWIEFCFFLWFVYVHNMLAFCFSVALLTWSWLKE